MKVEQILARKGNTALTVAPTDTVQALCRQLAERRIGAAVVSSDGRVLEGVISERDVARAIGAGRSDVPSMRVEALMTRSVITCSPRDDVAVIASTMLSRNIRHLPVLDGTALVGMISMRDVVANRVDDLQQQTAQLHAFINHASQPMQDRD